MATKSLEERVAELEAQVSRLLNTKAPEDKEIPWWERRFGAFKDDPYYDEAARLGAEYRRAQPTAADAESGNVSP